MGVGVWVWVWVWVSLLFEYNTHTYTHPHTQTQTHTHTHTHPNNGELVERKNVLINIETKKPKCAVNIDVNDMLTVVINTLFCLRLVTFLRNTFD